MKALNSIPGGIISGVALAIIVFVIVPGSASMNCRSREGSTSSRV